MAIAHLRSLVLHRRCRSGSHPLVARFILLHPRCYLGHQLPASYPTQAQQLGLAHIEAGHLDRSELGTVVMAGRLNIPVAIASCCIGLAVLGATVGCYTADFDQVSRMDQIHFHLGAFFIRRMRFLADLVVSASSSLSFADFLRFSFD